MTARRGLKAPCVIPFDQNDQRVAGVCSPVWPSRGNGGEAVSRRPRVAISASDDRNGRKFRDWISREAFEVDFSPEADPLIAMIGDTPHSWSTLILEVATLGEAGDVAAFVETHRCVFSRLFTVFLCNRQEQDEVERLSPDIRYVVLTKPFTRVQLMAVLTCGKSPKIETTRHIGLGSLD
ncbi:hypothetical protein ACSSV4_002206 [Roseovarius sp. MBR-154]|jgi:hypothetical protein